MSAASDPWIVVYRVSQVGGTAGTRVPTRLEVNDKVVVKRPEDAFISFRQPAGDFTLAATAMWGFGYAEQDRLTLRDRAANGEVAYFRIESVAGTVCAGESPERDDPAAAHATHYPRPDWPQTLCFRQVPEAVALEALAALRGTAIPR